MVRARPGCGLRVAKTGRLRGSAYGYTQFGYFLLVLQYRVYPVRLPVRLGLIRSLMHFASRLLYVVEKRAC